MFCSPAVQIYMGMRMRPFGEVVVVQRAHNGEGERKQCECQKEHPRQRWRLVRLVRRMALYDAGAGFHGRSECGNCSELGGSEQLSAGGEGVEVLGPPSAED